jgi:hypothetical protein
MGTEWKQTMVENGPLNTKAGVDVRFSQKRTFKLLEITRN